MGGIEDFEIAQTNRPKLTLVRFGKGGEVETEVSDGRPPQDHEEVVDHVMERLKTAKFTGKGDEERVVGMFKDYLHLLQRGVESAVEQALPGGPRTAVVDPADNTTASETLSLSSPRGLPLGGTLTATHSILAASGEVRV